MPDPKFNSFIYVRSNDKGQQESIGYSHDLDDLRTMAKGGQLPKEESSTTDEEEKVSMIQVGLGEDMRRALSIGFSQQHLILITDAFRQISSMSVGRELSDNFALPENCLETGELYKIYGLDEDSTIRYHNRIRQAGYIKEGMESLPSAILLSLVATFDSFVADIVRKMLRQRPERYSASDRVMSVRDILKLKSFDDFIGVVIEEETYGFTRGSHEEQVKFIEKHFHVPIIKSWPRWADFIEVFERRNLIAHGEPNYNQRYVDICINAGGAMPGKILGQPVELVTAYLRSAGDLLLEFSILLSFVLWRKHFEETEIEAFETLNETAFDLISNDRSVVARNILEFALSLKNPKITEGTRRMLVVNLASAHRHLGEDKRASEILDEQDWTASADHFKICVAALRGDVDTVSSLMRAVVDAKTVGKSSFRRWPVFKFLRKEPKFQQSFESIFEEPLDAKKTTTELKLDDTAVPPETEQPVIEKTVH